MPEEAIDPVLSSARATLSRAWPQTAVEEVPIGTFCVPMMPMKSVGSLPLALMLTDGPAGV